MRGRCTVSLYFITEPRPQREFFMYEPELPRNFCVKKMLHCFPLDCTENCTARCRTYANGFEEPGCEVTDMDEVIEINT